MRTRQEIFDLAWNGLKAQGFKRSKVVGGPRCLYRSQNGLKCAIGHCIPDEIYSPLMEEEGLDKVMEIIGVPDNLFPFAEDLQHAHDGAESPAGMEGNLRRFAERHSLTIPAQE